MWLNRVLSRIEQTPGHVALHGSERYGADFVFSAVAQRQRAAWVYLEAPDGGDAISQGNALAAALNRALGSWYFPSALPYGYHVKLLKSQSAQLGLPFILISHAEFAPGLTRSLLELPAEQCRVLVSSSQRDWEIASLAEEELALRPEEAAELCAQADLDLEALLAQTQGAYADVLLELSRVAPQVQPVLPGPDGGRDPQGLWVAPELLLERLLREERLLEALDVACAHLPQRVASLIARAGPKYQEGGLAERLYLNLRSLDDCYLEDEAVLEWFLVAAAATGRSESARPLVDAYLRRHPEALTLRSRRVGLEPDLHKRREEARFLASLQPTPLSLFQWGSVCPDPAEGADLLHAAVRLAEREGNAYAAIRNAGALARRLLHSGAYAKAASWAEWALRQCDRHQIRDGYRRLTIFNDQTYARLMLGQLANLRQELEAAQGTLEGVLPELALLYRSTLSETELAYGNLDKALELARVNAWQAPRSLVGKYIVPLTRMLLEAGKLQEADQESTLATHVSDGEYFGAGARLARGMVAAVQGAPEASALLLPVVEDATQPAERRCAAALYYLRASGRTFSDLPASVQSLFADMSRTGLYVLSGPEAEFHDLWGQVLGQRAPLRVKLLGKAEVTLHGKPLHLSKTQLELLALLALHPQGLSLEALQTRLFTEGSGKRVNLKMNLSRLRKRLPISSAPYKIGVPYTSDTQECATLAGQGRLREALSLYQGPVLAASEAPAIEEHRAQLDELMRQAVLASDDPDVLLDFARRGQDLEVWERALEVLSGLNDPRRVLAKASILHLRRDYGLS